MARGGREESAGRVVAFLPNFCSPRRGEIGGGWEVLLLFGIFGFFGFLGVKGGRWLERRKMKRGERGKDWGEDSKIRDVKVEE